MARAEQELAKARDALLEAVKEVKVLDRHREKWAAERKLEEERLEQKTLDEVSIIQYHRRPSD